MLQKAKGVPFWILPILDVFDRFWPILDVFSQCYTATQCEQGLFFPPMVGGKTKSGLFCEAGDDGQRSIEWLRLSRCIPVVRK